MIFLVNGYGATSAPCPIWYTASVRPLLTLCAFFPLTLVSLPLSCGTSSSAGNASGLTEDPPPGTDDAGSSSETDGATSPDGNEPEDDGTCEIVSPDAESGVFVATNGSDDGTCGERTSPCRSITMGAQRAAEVAKPNVYVGRGTYTERVTLRAGAKIIGGWKLVDGTWARVCKNPESAVVVRAPVSENITIEARDLGGEASVSFIRIESKAATDVGPSESIYGVFAAGETTTLRLDHVSISAADAGHGTDGKVGTDGANAPATCELGTGQAGTAGTEGKSAVAAFGAEGFVATEATSGTNGTDGANSVAGAAGECLPCGACNGLCLFEKRTGTTCGGAGGSGCGGGGGAAGTAGGSGGSSVGVYVWDAHVSLTASEVSAGNGGNGGSGGKGGKGKAGTVGAKGAAGTNVCLTSCKGLVVSCQENKSAGQGGAGATGGKGGDGGNGGSGAGGSSFALYQGGNGLLNVADTTLAHGTPGTGGKGPLPADDGVAGDRFP